VTKKIRYQIPYLNIFLDLTGELTGLGPNTWATAYHKHNEMAPECTADISLMDGITCDSTVQIRRLAFHNFEKVLELEGMPFYVLPYDDSIISATNLTEYKLDIENYGKIEFKPKKNPSKSWTFGLVTGHKYKIHWGTTGVDFEKMQIDLSDRWEETDKNLYLIHNFTDVRALMDITIGETPHFNNTIPVG
jgi:hypothetical protein